MTLALDNPLVPWIYTNSDAPIVADFIGIGRPVENVDPCVRGYDPLIPPPPPPPRTCEDFYTYGQNRIEDKWVSVKTAEE